jgi:hypothetical protein
MVRLVKDRQGQLAVPGHARWWLRLRREIAEKFGRVVDSPFPIAIESKPRVCG